MNGSQSAGNIGGLAPAEYRARAVFFTDLVELCEWMEKVMQYLKHLEDLMLTMENVGMSKYEEVHNEAYETLLGGLRYYQGILSVYAGTYPKLMETSFVSGEGYGIPSQKISQIRANIASFAQRLTIAEEETESYEGSLYALIESGGQQEAMLKAWNDRLATLRCRDEAVRRWMDDKSEEWSKADAGIADMCDDVGEFVLRIEIANALNGFYDRAVSILADATMLDASNVDTFLRTFDPGNSDAVAMVSEVLKAVGIISRQADFAKSQCGTYPGAQRIEGISFSDVGNADVKLFGELIESRKVLFRMVDGCLA